MTVSFFMELDVVDLKERRLKERKRTDRGQTTLRHTDRRRRKTLLEIKVYPRRNG